MTMFWKKSQSQNCRVIQEYDLSAIPLPQEVAKIVNEEERCLAEYQQQIDRIHERKGVLRRKRDLLGDGPYTKKQQRRIERINGIRKKFDESMARYQGLVEKSEQHIQGIYAKHRVSVVGITTNHNQEEARTR